MSKKKKEQAAAAAAALKQQEAYLFEQERMRAEFRPTASFRKMTNSTPVPVAPPADFIQLTPIVQPIPIVPYSTQMQPLAQIADDDEPYYY